MKSIFEFKLPEEQHEFNIYNSASGYRYAIDRIFDEARKLIRGKGIPDFINYEKEYSDCNYDDHKDNEEFKLGYTKAVEDIDKYLRDQLSEINCYMGGI